VVSVLLHVVQVKQLRWYTESLARITISEAEMPRWQRAHLCTENLLEQHESFIIKIITQIGSNVHQVFNERNISKAHARTLLINQKSFLNGSNYLNSLQVIVVILFRNTIILGFLFNSIIRQACFRKYSLNDYNLSLGKPPSCIQHE